MKPLSSHISSLSNSLKPSYVKKNVYISTTSSMVIPHDVLGFTALFWQMLAFVTVPLYGGAHWFIFEAHASWKRL